MLLVFELSPWVLQKEYHALLPIWRYHFWIRLAWCPNFVKGPTFLVANVRGLVPILTLFCPLLFDRANRNQLSLATFDIRRAIPWSLALSWHFWISNFLASLSKLPKIGITTLPNHSSTRQSHCLVWLHLSGTHSKDFIYLPQGRLFVILGHQIKLWFAVFLQWPSLIILPFVSFMKRGIPI